MTSRIRTSVAVGAVAGGLTALAVFGGTGAFLAAAQDSPDTTVEPESPGTTESPDPQSREERREQLRAEREQWRQCMADNGFELPAPQLDEDGRPVRPKERPRLDGEQRQAFRDALEACGRPPLRRHHRWGPGRECDDTAPDAPPQPAPEPEAEGSSYAA